MAAKPSKLQQLADLTTAQDLTPEPNTILSETLFPVQTRKPTDPVPQMPSRETAERRPTDPRPQMPMLQTVQPEGQKRRPMTFDPALPPEVGAALHMVGLIAVKAPGFWKVMLPNAASFVSNGGGGMKQRFQTGVRLDATAEEWMQEINQFWKDVHPNEPLPFGGY